MMGGQRTPRGRRARGHRRPPRGRRTPHVRRARGRRGWLLVLGAVLAFAVSRLLPLALTFDPSLYGPEISDPTGDVDLYRTWGELIVADGLEPYDQIDIEYPPGALPFVIVPALLGQGTFSLPLFVLLLFVVDALGFAALLVLAARTRVARGAVVWLLGPPVLGVLLYARLDVIPAVATLLALERAHARHWFSCGVFFGLGAAAKLFPALLLPLALVAAISERRGVMAGADPARAPGAAAGVAPPRPGAARRLLGGAALGAAAAWLPFAADSAAMAGDVLGYHSARGIHLESLWGSLLNLQRITGGPADLVFEFGAYHIAAPAAPALLRVTTIASLAVVALCLLVALWRWRRWPRLAGEELALAATTMLALLLGTGRVFSPQFMLWLLAAAAVAFAVRPRVALWAGPLLALAVVLTALGYPLGFDLLRDGARWPAQVLLARNLVVNVLGAGLLVHWCAAAPPSGAGRRGGSPRPGADAVDVRAST